MVRDSVIISIFSQNVAHGALNNAFGEYEDRWPLLVERISRFKPDILLLTELTGWSKNGHKQLARAANDLDMDAAPISPSSSGFATGLLYRKETVGRWQAHSPDFYQETTHGFAITAFDVGLPALLNVIPVHLTFYSSLKAIQEAQLVASRGYWRSPFGIIGGDCNYSPADGPRPDYRLSKPYNWGARTVISSGKDVKPKDMLPDRRVAWTFKRAGYVDAAYRMYQKTHDKKLLSPTVFDERIDQFWVSSAMDPALLSYSMTKQNPDASDHAGIAIRIDTNKVDTKHMWKPETF